MILDGITVVEVGSGSIGTSLAGMLLADAGARVRKVEPPRGDRLRRESPAGFLVWNRGKDSVVLDLHEDDGRRGLADLVAGADVVLEGFGTGVAERFGCDADLLCGRDTRLVHCSVKGFGATGPHAHLKAYEGVVAAKAGVFTRRTTFRPGPVFVNSNFASVGVGHLAHGGVLAALIARARTGEGQRIEATMVQGLHPYDYFGTMQWQYDQANPSAPTRQQRVSAERYGLSLCSQDGHWVVISTMLTHQCHAMLRALELDHLLDEERFRKAPTFAGADDAQAYQDLLWWTFRQRTLDEWRPRLLAERDIAFEAVVTSEAALGHPQVAANGDAITVLDPVLGPVRQTAPVGHFTRTPLEVSRSAPALGDGARPTPTGPRPHGDPPVGSTPPHPLSGITIVEFGYFFAMPFGVTLAASLGARVIKVEDLRGDPMRWTWGTKETSGVKVTEGKESLAVDLGTSEGKRLVHQIVAGADVFVQSFRPGVAERLGVDEPSLRTANPELLYVDASGYGSTGPYSDRALYAFTASAFAGSYHRQSPEWLDVERCAAAELDELDEISKRIVNTSEGDAYAALALFSALMLGIYERSVSGRGQRLRTSMLGGNSLALADGFSAYDGKPDPPRVDPDMYGLHALYRLYRARAGWLFLAAPTPAEWERLVAVLDRPEELAAPSFATAEGRALNDADLVDALGGLLVQRDASDWERILTAAGIGGVEVFEGTMAEFTNTDPVLRETELVAEVDHPLFGPVLRHGVPVRLSATPGRLAPGCLTGEHTGALLTELGYSTSAIEDLVERGVVRHHG
jgi:crotonobetainyl-CoA:carnitine CoA-transferase CaiB-like acyl-CoA transferase